MFLCDSYVSSALGHTLPWPVSSTGHLILAQQGAVELPVGDVRGRDVLLGHAVLLRELLHEVVDERGDVAATLGVLHFFWLVKKDLRPPLVYAAVLAVLLGLRIWWRYSKSRSSTVRRPSARAFSIARSQSPRTASESGATTRSDVLKPERPRT